MHNKLKRTSFKTHGFKKEMRSIYIWNTCFELQYVVNVEKQNKEHRSMEYVLGENESTTYFYLWIYMQKISYKCDLLCTLVNVFFDNSTEEKYTETESETERKKW